MKGGGGCNAEHMQVGCGQRGTLSLRAHHSIILVV